MALTITWADYGRIRGALDGLNLALSRARAAIKAGDRDAAGRWLSRAFDHKYFAIKWFPPFTVNAHKTIGFDEIYGIFRDIDVLVRMPDWLELTAEDRIKAVEKALAELRGIRGLGWMPEDDHSIQRLDRMIRALERLLADLQANSKATVSHTEVLSEKVCFLNEMWDDPEALFGERVYFEFSLIDDSMMEAQRLLVTDADLDWIDRLLRYAEFTKDVCLKPFLPTPPVDLIPPDQGAEDLPKRPNLG